MDGGDEAGEDGVMAGVDEDAVRNVGRVRFASGSAESSEDQVAREEPLEIQIGSAPLGVVMRTPGAAAGRRAGTARRVRRTPRAE